MLIDAIRDYVSYAEMNQVRGLDLKRVKELMITLRRAGFKSAQIAKLSGGRWKNNIRLYTNGWGGVDEALNNERIDIIDTLRDFVKSGRSYDEVKTTVDLEKVVRAEGSSLEEVADLSIYMARVGLLVPSSVSTLSELAHDLIGDGKNKPISVNEVRWWIRFDSELIEDGLDKSARIKLREISLQFGGKDLSPTLEALKIYSDIEVLRAQRQSDQAAAETAKKFKDELTKENLQLLDSIVKNRAKLEADSKMYISMMKAKALGYNDEALALLSRETERYGGIDKFTLAMGMHEPLFDIRAEMEKANSEKDKAIQEKEEAEREKVRAIQELASINSQISENKAAIIKLKEEIDDYTELIKRDHEISNLAILMRNPEKVKQRPEDLFYQLIRLTAATSMAMKANENLRQYYGESWDEAVKSLNDYSKILNSIMSQLISSL